MILYIYIYIFFLFHFVTTNLLSGPNLDFLILYNILCYLSGNFIEPLDFILNCLKEAPIILHKVIFIHCTIILSV